MMRTLREPYIELMFSLNGQRRGRSRTSDMNPPPGLLACLITVRMTTEYVPPYSPTHGPPGWDERRDAPRDARTRRTRLLAYPQRAG